MASRQSTLTCYKYWQQPHVNIYYCVIVIFTYMGRKSIKSDKKIDIMRGLGSVTKVQPEVKVILDEQGPFGNTDQGTISWFHVTKLEMWGKTHIMQLIILCEVNSSKCGSHVTRPDRGQRPMSSQVTHSHISMILISCLWPLNATSLLGNSQILILKSILINRGLNPWSLTVMSSKLLKSVLICTIFTKSNVCVCLCFLYGVAFDELR